MLANEEVPLDGTGDGGKTVRSGEQNLSGTQAADP
jgi:hypothetical protein